MYHAAQLIVHQSSGWSNHTVFRTLPHRPDFNCPRSIMNAPRAVEKIQAISKSSCVARSIRRGIMTAEDEDRVTPSRIKPFDMVSKWLAGILHPLVFSRPVFFNLWVATQWEARLQVTATVLMGLLVQNVVFIENR